MEDLSKSNENEVNKYGTNKYISEEELYELAQRRLKIKQSFFTHFGTYCVVNTGILFLCLFLFHTMVILVLSAVGWGIGLGCHYIDTVSKLKLDFKDSKLVEREMEFIKRKMQ